VTGRFSSMLQADAWRIDRQAHEGFMDEAERKRLIEAMAQTSSSSEELPSSIGRSRRRTPQHERGFKAVSRRYPPPRPSRCLEL